MDMRFQDKHSHSNDMLLASIDREHFIDRGKYNAVFRLDTYNPDLERFLLRVPLSNIIQKENGEITPTSSLRAKLESTTALTPPKYLYTRRNVAQPLLTLPSVMESKPWLQLMEEQRGESLMSFVVKANKKEGLLDYDTHGYEKLLEQLMGDGTSSLSDLFVDWYHLIELNKKPASTLQNIFYSPGSSCTAIDAFDNTDLLPVAKYSPMKRVTDAYMRSRFDYRCDSFFARLTQRCENEEAIQSFSEFFEEAKDEALQKVESERGRSGKAFIKSKDMKAISLSKSPIELKMALDDLITERARTDESVPLPG